MPKYASLTPFTGRVLAWRGFVWERQIFTPCFLLLFFSFSLLLLLYLATGPGLGGRTLAACFLLFGGFLFVRARDRPKRAGYFGAAAPQPSLKKLQPQVVSRERERLFR